MQHDSFWLPKCCGTLRIAQQCFLLTSGMSRNFTDYLMMGVKYLEAVKRRLHATKQWSSDKIRVWQEHHMQESYTNEHIYKFTNYILLSTFCLLCLEPYHAFQRRQEPCWTKSHSLEPSIVNLVLSWFQQTPNVIFNQRNPSFLPLDLCLLKTTPIIWGNFDSRYMSVLWFGSSGYLGLDKWSLCAVFRLIWFYFQHCKQCGIQCTWTVETLFMGDN